MWCSYDAIGSLPGLVIVERCTMFTVITGCIVSANTLAMDLPGKHKGQKIDSVFSLHSRLLGHTVCVVTILVTIFQYFGLSNIHMGNNIHLFNVGFVVSMWVYCSSVLISKCLAPTHI